MLVATNRAPGPHRGRRPVEAVVVELPVEAHDHRVGGAGVDRDQADLGERLAHPRAGAHEHAARRRGATGRGATPAAIALVTTSSGVAGTPMRGELGDHVVDRRARVVRQERHPQSGGAQLRDAVGRGRDRARRPARSRRRGRRHTTGGRSVAVTSARRRRALERVPVVVLVGPHRHRQLEVAAGAEAVALAEQAQAEPEVGVVVDRVDLDRPLELLARRGEAAACGSTRGASVSRTEPLSGSRSRARSSATPPRAGSATRAGGCPPGTRRRPIPWGLLVCVDSSGCAAVGHRALRMRRLECARIRSTVPD